MLKDTKFREFSQITRLFVFLEGRNLAQLCDVMNAELANVDAWLCSNKLSFVF